MIYSTDLTVPADTAKLAPVRADLVLTAGIITKVEVQFLAGCNGTVYVAINRALHQIWPTNPDGAFRSNNYTISFPTYYELLEAPYQVEIYGWSPGTTYQHVIQVRLGLQRPEVLNPLSRTQGIIERLGAVILGRR